MDNQVLLKLGPFSGLDLTTDPYALQPNVASAMSNVDPSLRLGVFALAFGRSKLGTIALPSGYAINAITALVSFSGTATLTSRRIFVFSASNASGATYQGWYDPAIPQTTQLPHLRPFTSAVQFGSALWTNGGDKVYFLTNGTVDSDPWQISVPYLYAYQVSGTYLTASGSAPVDTYTYAITLRKAEYWTVQGSGVPFTYQPDIDSLQESSPIFSTSVTISSGQQPGFTVPTALSLAPLIQGVTFGDDTYYGCLYRSRTSAPTYVFVDYLANMTQENDHAGNPSIIDTYPDPTASAYLTIHHDPPPMQGLTYSGATALNSSPNSIAQSSQQTSFTYTNPTFITKHKSRMWAFTLYPTQPLGAGPSSPETVSFQPQLWYSDYGTPWSFNAAQGVLLVGPEDTPGNYSVDSNAATNPPWEPSAIEDTPVGLVSIGSLLVAFKNQSTWIVTGDSPAEFIPRRAFDIGCIAPGCIIPAEGGVFFLAQQGVYFFDGAAPTYISEHIRAVLDGYSTATLATAVGGYKKRTFYLSIEGVTWCYYIPTQQWYQLPYGADGMLSLIYPNELVLLNGATAGELDLLGTAVSDDLGTAITGTWTGPVTDSGQPGVLKAYRMLQVVAPHAVGFAKIVLTLDPNFGQTQSQTWIWDLSKGNGAFVASCNLKGYEAQLSITATQKGTTPLIVRWAAVYGSVEDSLMPTSNIDQSGALNGVTNG